MKREPITEQLLLSVGFIQTDYDEDLPFTSFLKDQIEVWNYNNECWVVEMLDQNGIEKEFHYFDELQKFFDACGLKLNYL